MANEITLSSLSDQRIAAGVSARVIELFAARQSLPMHVALRYAGSIVGTLSDVIKTPGVARNGYDRMSALGSETGSTSNTAQTDSSYELTVATYFLQRTLGDMARTTGTTDPIIALGDDLFASYLNTLVYVVSQLTDNFTAVKGASGAPATMEDWLNAHTALDVAGAPPDRLAILHPQQWGDLRVDGLLNAGGAWQFSPVAENMIAAMGQGAQGTIGRTLVYTTDFVPSSGGNYLGAIMGADSIIWGDGVPPVDSDIGDILIGGKVKVRKVAVDQSILTRLIGTTQLGARLGIDARGCTFRSAVP
mgnify:FL=1